jgi:hypothetical protein
MDTKSVQSTLQSPISQQLYLTFELSQKQWNFCRCLEYKYSNLPQPG